MTGMENLGMFEATEKHARLCQRVRAIRQF
jgi:hypothetical protein